MDNIIINFTSDPSGLQPGIDGLVQMKVVDKELADQVKQTSDVLQKQNQAASTSVKQAGTDLQKLSSNFQQLDKIVAGSAAGKVVQNLQQQIKSTAVSIQQLSTEPIQKVAQSFNNTADSTMRAQSQLRLYKSELARLAEGGQQGTPQFQAILNQATELEHALTNVNRQLTLSASNIAGIEALKEAFTGLIGGAQVFAGVIGVLTNNQGQAEEITKDLISLMSILNGLEQVGAVLAKNSALNQYILALYRRLNAAATAEEAAATTALNTTEEANIAVTEGATVAQTALNVAMDANPAVILFGALAAIATALVLFSDNTDEAAEKQKKLNEQLKNEAEFLDSLNKLLNVPNDNLIKKLNDELTLLQSRKASQNEILAKEHEIAAAETDRAAKSAGFYEQERKDLGLNRAALESYQQKLRDLKDELTVSTDPGFLKRIFGNSDRTKDDIQKNIDQVQAGIDAVGKQVEQGQKAQDDLDTASAAEQAKRNEIERFNYEQSLKSTTAYWEARVAESVKGSKAELDAQMQAIRVRTKNEIAANPNITPGETIKAKKEALRQIEELQFNFDQKQMADQVKLLNDRAALQKEESRKRLDLELQALDVAEVAEKQSVVKIAAEKLKGLTNGSKDEIEFRQVTAKQLEDIDDRYLKARSDKIKQYAKADAEAEINARLAITNAQISKLSVSADAATNNQLLDLKKKLVDQEAQLEIISINDTVHNEEARREKVKAVYAKALADKINLEKQKNATENQNNFDFVDAIYQREVAKNQLIVLNDKTTAAQRKKALTDLNNFAIFSIDAQRAKIEQDHADGIISDQKYYTELANLEKQDYDRQVQLEQQLLQMKEQKREKVLDIEKTLVDGVFDQLKDRYQAEINADQQLYDNKVISLQEFNKRKDIIAAKQAESEKAKALFDIAIDLAKSIFQIETQAAILGLTPIVGPALEAEALAQIPFLIGESVVQSAIILAKKYAAGGKIEGPGHDTSDNIPIWASPGEYITKAKQTRKHGAALKAINEDRYQEYLMKHELPKLYQNLSAPVLPDHVQTTTLEAEKIDYEKLSEVLAQKLAENPQHILSFDENGFHLAVKKGNDKIEYVNKKLST